VMQVNKNRKITTVMKVETDNITLHFWTFSCYISNKGLYPCQQNSVMATRGIIFVDGQSGQRGFANLFFLVILWCRSIKTEK
jgi:hypothetical protein